MKKVIGLVPSLVVAIFSTFLISAEEFKITLAPLNPDFVEYQKKINGKGNQPQYSNNGHPLGLIPSPVDLSYAKGIQLLWGAKYQASPAYYDLRIQGRLTTVKNQGQCKSCWAFATMGCLESYFMPSEVWDFSENHLKNTHGFDPSPCEGGGPFISIAYLTRWGGPVLESEDPYNPSDSQTSPSGLQARKHVQDILILPSRANAYDNENIKQAIMNYGGAFSGMRWPDAVEGTYYNPSTFSFVYNGSNPDNHAVVIVGWDDNYDRNRFTPVPPGNGAFIVRNSWGTSWGDGGYFYISYWDLRIGQSCGVLTLAEPSINYTRNYYYDKLGWTRIVGIWDSSLGYSSDTAWGANVFTAAANENLAAIGFFATYPNSIYDVYVYTNVSNLPTNGSLVAHVQGNIPYMGYFTIPMQPNVPLTSGQKFSVVLKLTTPGYIYPLAIEAPIPGYSSQATANTNESFVSPDGNSWMDLTYPYQFRNCNFCLKAFTRGSSTPTEQLFCAHVANSSVWKTQFFLINVGSEVTPVTISAVNPQGNTVGTYNISALSPLSAFQADIDSIFSSVLSQNPDVWLKVQANSELKGLMMFGTRDNQAGTCIPMDAGGAQDLIFPYVASVMGYYTGATLVNTGSANANVQMTAYKEDGTFLDIRTTVIPPGGKYARLIDGIFSGVDPALIRFLKVHSDQPLIGFELFGSFTANGLAGISAFTSSSPSSTLYYAEIPNMAKMYQDGDPGFYFTGMTVSNQGSYASTIHLELYGYSGSLLTQRDWPSAVNPQQQVTREVSDLFGGVPIQEAGFGKISSSVPLIGFELFLSQKQQYPFQFEGLPAVASGSRKLFFPVLWPYSDWQPFLSIINSSNSSNVITIHYISLNGTESTTQNVTLQPWQKAVGYLSKTIPFDWIYIEAQNPIIADMFMFHPQWLQLCCYLGLPEK